MGVMPNIAPSMLSSDFANLSSEAHRILDSGADWLHMDIMAICPQFNHWCSRHRKFEKAHIGIFGLSHDGYKSLDYVEALGKAGASGFTFHVETSKDNWQELIESIKSQGMRPGVALNPGTPIGEVYPLVRFHLVVVSRVLLASLVHYLFEIFLNCVQQLTGNGQGPKHSFMNSPIR
ncbi:hypothetical protein PIB30_077816 [Stylosanthes scabra]|uniref:Ribulose-phosphate 3-epimerase n=1 Tax=Stylosanthes scabra TaxID=79078 RepID=A0ABU6SQR4_9FABA|nr:hypothetical protein [Stylosanthes scabra]